MPPVHRLFQATLLVLLAGFFLILPSGRAVARPAYYAADDPAGCETPGWFPEEFGLKDHSIFWHTPYYYIVSNLIPGENRFAYARSKDLCSWEVLPPILNERIRGTWEESSIWAPFVFEEDGVFYMYYTGVNFDFTQSIMLATSTNPADPASWQPQGLIFQPSHGEIKWDPENWSDCRDPFVVKDGGQYHLFYTAFSVRGAAVGLATSQNPAGPWKDLGPVAFTSFGQTALESPAIYAREGWFYLFYNHVSYGEEYQVSRSLAGPWSLGGVLTPGWAHEIWTGQDGLTYTSYLTDYTVTISPLAWNAYLTPSRPMIGGYSSPLLLPLMFK